MNDFRYKLTSTLFSLLSLSIILLGSTQAEARPKYFFKIASVAPEGSVWVTQFEEFAKEVTKETKGEVGFRVYSGGIMGDDQAMLRKMRVGQLHGGGFTMSGISNVVADFRVMALPFFFQSYQEVDAVVEGLLPTLRQRFSDNGVELIALTEVGFIYTMATQPTVTTKELQQSKSWIPSGDPIASEFFSTVGISPIPLSVPDVLPALQTGMINTVYNSLYGSIVFQWFPKARYITDEPYGYAYGVFALDKRKFSKLPPEYGSIIHRAAKKHFKILIDQTRQSNKDSRQVLKDYGITFVPSTPQVIKELQDFRDQSIDKLVGKYFSKEIYQLALKLLKDFRNTNASKDNQ